MPGPPVVLDTPDLEHVKALMLEWCTPGRYYEDAQHWLRICHHPLSREEVASMLLGFRGAQFFDAGIIGRSAHSYGH